MSVKSQSVLRRAPSGPVLDHDLREHLVSELRPILGRRDSARKAVSWISTVTALSPDETFELTDVARAAGPDWTPKKYSQLLDAGEWPESRIGATLLDLAAPADTSALMLNVETVTNSTGQPTYDIGSVQSVTPLGPVPIAWSRIRQPQAGDEDDRVQVSELEAKLVLDLLRQIPDFYLDAAQAPILARDIGLGVSEAVRSALQIRGLEYVFDVESFDAPFFTGVQLETHPASRQRQPRTVAEILPRPPEGALAGAATRVVDSDEWAVGLRRAGGERVALAMPRVASEGPLRAGRLRARTNELASLSAACSWGGPARRLRISTFRHSSDLGWQRHAMLMSLAGARSDLARAKAER